MEVVNINYSNINNTNIYMSYIIIGISLYIIIQLYASIFAKFNININMFTNGISTSFIDLNMSSFNNYFKDYVRYRIASIINPINCRLDHETQQLTQINSNASEFNENVQRNIRIENKYKLKKYNEMYEETKTNIETLKDTIIKINDAYLENSEYVKNMYTTYSNKIKDFVNNLFNVLNVLQYQFNLAYITPTLNLSIKPIKELYNSIYNILLKNTNYVNKYVTNYTISDLKPISSKMQSPENLSSDFTNSNKIIQNLNI
jgi:hypothetical protein